MGAHLPNRARPVATWTYRAEVFDDADPAKPAWVCDHNHESPQLAHGCAANWVEDAEQEEQTA